MTPTGPADRIRQLERMTRELSTREARWRAIFDAEPEGVALLAADGTVIEMNATGLRMIEADALERVRHQPVEPLVVPELRPQFRDFVTRVFAGESLTLEFEIVGLRGTRRWLSAHASPLRDEQGQVTALLGIARDISDRKAAEAAVRESNERLRLAVQASNVGIWDWDLRTNQVVYSREWKSQLGYAEQEITHDYEEWRQRVHPEDLPGTLERLERYLKQPGSLPQGIEFRMRHKDGSWRWIYARGQVYRDPSGAPQRMVGCHVDVTERRRSEQNVRQLNRTYAVLSDINQLIVRERGLLTLLEGACRIAVEKGGFLLAWVGLAPAGSSRLELTAHAGATLETLKIVRSIVEADGESGRCEHTQEALRTGQPSICNDIQNDPRGASWRDAALARGYRAMAALPLSRAGETIGTFNLYASESAFFDAAEVALLSQLAADISLGLESQRREERRVEAERALRASEERFRELAETIQEVFWITDAHKTQMLYVSPAYETVWGRTCASVYESPQSWLDAIHPDDRPRIAGAAVQQARGGYDEEYRILRPEGEIRWIRERAFPVRGEHGQVERLVGVARDVTDRKAAELQMREAQKMESVGRLAAGLAHDFNNVLTIINGMAELALGELAEDSPLREHLLGIQSASGRAVQLTRQLLAFSRKQVLHPTVVQLNLLVREAQTLLQRVLGDDVRVEVALMADMPPVRVDPGQFHQVILNLALNSRDAMPHGGTFRIETRLLTIEDAQDRLHPTLARGRYAVLVISDTGFGMDDATRQRLFEPFFTTKEPGKGTGLGLATVHGIVKQSGGEIEVHTVIGRGSTFTIYLPVTDEAQHPPVDTAPSASRGAECILVVDDDAGVRTLTRRLLERAGFNVLVAADALQALDVVAMHRHEIDLVLTDVVMPGMSGRELAEELWRVRPELRVLFMSGYTEDAIARHGVLARGTHLISKPYSAAELTAKVRQVLDS